MSITSSQSSDIYNSDISLFSPEAQWTGKIQVTFILNMDKQQNILSENQHISLVIWLREKTDPMNQLSKIILTIY